MIKPKVCMITTSNLDYDTRILNEIDTLSANFDITIVTPGYNRKLEINKKFRSVVSLYRPYFKISKDLNRFLNLFALIKAVKKENPDIIHAHDLPGLFCARLATIFKSKTIVYDSHELWSDLNLFGFWRVLRWPLRISERILISKVVAVITVNKSLARILEEKYHRPTIALYNYPLLQKNKTSVNTYNTKTKTILYVGAFRNGRGLYQIIKAAQILDDSYKFLFIGYGREENRIRAKIKKLSLENKIFVKPPLNFEQLLPVIKKASLCLCLIENTSQSYYYSSPNKLFQYIAAQVPILASNFPEYRQIVLKEKIGELVDVEPEKIAQKISHMIKYKQQMLYRQNLKGLAQKRYNWTIEAPKLLDFYTKLSYNPTDMKDFTLEQYKWLCRQIASEYKSVTLADYLQQKPTKKVIVLKHDIDRGIKTALEMAKIEHQYGLVASYYFRIPATWDPEIIAQISQMGHEVGLHYESLDKAKGDHAKAIKLFEADLETMRKKFKVKTISMHGNPFTRFDNRDIWKDYDLKKFGLIGEAYLSVDFEKIMYYSDTGRTWEDDKFNVKDIIPKQLKRMKNKPKIISTPDLINLIGKESRSIYLLIHPNRWAENDLAWFGSFASDSVINWLKMSRVRFTRF